MRNGKITKFGRILRATGLDELPQIYNILKGDMSLIGPRPLTKFDIDRLGWQRSEFDDRWSVRPGIVGLAQLSYSCHSKLTIF